MTFLQAQTCVHMSLRSEFVCPGPSHNCSKLIASQPGGRPAEYLACNNKNN